MTHRIILLVFFLFNLLFTGFQAISHDKASGDALSYYALAVNLYEGEGFSRDYKGDLAISSVAPPFENQGRFLYPFLSSLAFQVFGASIPTANLVAALFKALLVIPIILIGKYLFDDTTGLLAGLVYTFNPTYLALGVITMPETTAAFFYYLSILLMLRYYQTQREAAMAKGAVGAPALPGRMMLVWAGLALSLSYLARPEGLFLLLLGVAAVALSSRRWCDLLGQAIFPALTLTFGSLVINGRIGNVSPYQTPLTTLPDWADYYVLAGFDLSTYLDRVGGVGGALGVRVFNCLLFLKHTFADGLWLDRVVGLLPFTMLPAIIMALFVGRAPFRDTPAPTRSFAPLSVTGLGTTALSGNVFLYLLSLFIAAQFILTIGYPGYPRMSADYRHGQIVGPFLIILAAAGLAFLLRGCGRTRLAQSLCRVVGWLLVFHYVVFCVVFLSIAVNDTLWIANVRTPMVEASEWMRDNLLDNAVVMSRKPVAVNYDSGLTTIVIPTAPYADIMEYAKQHGVTHFLMTDLEWSGLPNLKQGLEVYSDHFKNVYTTDTFSVLAVDSYDYGGERPTVEDDWYVGPENVRRHLYEWDDLWDFGGSSALEDARDVWSQWLIRLRRNAWSLAKDREIPKPMEYPVEARFGDNISLLGYDLNVDTVRPGDTVELTLYWRCLQPMTVMTGQYAPSTYTVFTHALDESGMVRAQQDNPPLGGAYPTSRWEEGEIIRDRYSLVFATDSPKGQYTIEVGMYDAQSGERLPVYDLAGRELPDRRVMLGPVKVK